MKKMSSQGKARIAPVGVAAVLGMAGMGLVSSGVVMADVSSVTDTINITVQSSCTFNSVEDKTYTGSAANGTEVNDFTESGIHEFNLFCNDNNGFVVTATPYDLEATGVTDVIAYTDNYTHTGVNSMWTAEIASDTAGVTVASPVPVGGGTIVSSDSSTTAAGVDFTATYKAYVGTATPAGTYTGTIEYTLTAAGTSNSVSGGGDDNSGNGETGDSGENGGQASGGGETGGSETGSGDNSGTDSGNDVTDNSGSGDTPSNSPQSAAPKALNNTYNSYSTTNTYNTTNYSGGSGASTPALASTQGVTSGDSDGDDSEVSNSYEKPLGVTTKTDAPASSSSSSSNEGSGVDPLPLIAAGAALAAAGVAAVAVAKSDKKEE